ncbi:hypothetical protein [Actinoplanes sp. OR16]|uniref:plasmid mobilization protein n=1 Tax=Actinoplanes sp. OR16 TaxID=946334 RepID=UPI000FD7FC05|nr:hypothetical protein [Actinoplanes sp. OR16]
MEKKHERPLRHRRHLSPGRPRRINARFTTAEADQVTVAAHRAGLTPSGYVALMALTAASAGATPHLDPLRAVLGELSRTRIALTTVDPELLPGVIDRVDAVLQEIRAGLPR